MGFYVSLPIPKTNMNWDTDSLPSGLSSPRSLSPSPFNTPLTPVDPVWGFGKTIPKNRLDAVSRKLIDYLEEIVQVSRGTPSQIGLLQNSSIGLPIQSKEPPAPFEQTDDLLEDIRKR